MKTLLAVACSLAFVSPLCAADFAKGDKVELTKDAPIYFKDAVLRIAHTGERFTVILQNAATRKVYLSVQDALGKEIAVSVLDSDLRKAGSEPAPQIPRKELREATPEQAVYLAETKMGNGSGFVVQINGACYLVTNAHVVASVAKVEFKNPAGRITITSGQVEVADDRDMVRFPSQSDAGLLLGNEVKADDETVAYGNSGGEGVVTKLPGRVLGVGVDRLEVSCEIISGNSGGPILNAQSRVLAVSSYLTNTGNVAEWIKNGTRFDKARRFGYRLTEGIKWTSIPFPQFVSESTQIVSISELSDHFAHLLNQLLFHTFEAELENKFPKNGELANFITTYNRATKTLSNKDGTLATDKEIARSNSKLKATAASLTSDLVRIIDSAATDFRFKAQQIRTPYFRKKAQEILTELSDTSKFVIENAKAASGSNFLKAVPR